MAINPVIPIDANGNAVAGAIGAAAPPAAVVAGATDGTNTQVPRVHDLDTGVGTDFTLGVSLRKAAGGGSVALGTAADPVRTDPTGTTTQPVTLAAVPLPAGAATEATLTAFAGAVATALATQLPAALGAALSAASFSVVLASDHATVPVSEQMDEIMVRKAMIAALNHQLAFDASGARIRVVIDTGTLTTCSTVTTVTNIAQLGGVVVRDMLIVPTERNLIANKIRRLIV